MSAYAALLKVGLSFKTGKLIRQLGLLSALIPSLLAQTSTAPCDLNGDGAVNIADVQIAVNEVLGLSACTMNLDGTGTCDVADVQRVITAALGGACVVTPPASSTITLPIEVMGPSGTTASVSFSIASASASLLGGTQTLSLQIHGLKYQTESSVQVNNSGWIPINSSNVTLQGLANAYGGIGGGFHTLSMTMSLPAGTVVTGNNTVSFMFNGTDGVTSGFRVLALNVLGSDGSSLVPASTFVWDDPSNWQAPSTAASDIAAGQTLYTTAALTVPVLSGGTAAIQAHCSDCHAQDGRDLKYFNYSNNAIQVRSVFHGLTAQQGNQITSYIRSLDYPNPGRPWNPPYQPGAGLDSQPVADWAAGAGLSAVLSSDGAMQSYLEPSGSTAGWAANQYLNPRELPIALQFPDWNSWLPTIHPMDAYGASFTGSAAASDYTLIRSALQPNSASAYQANHLLFAQWDNDVGDFLGPLESPTSWTAAERQSVYAVMQWQMAKLWEVNQDFGLEGMPQAVFGSKADLRGWDTNTPFYVSPNMLHIGVGPGLGNGTQASWEYLAYIWYHLQLVLNDGQGAQSDHSPIDYDYVSGILKDFSNDTGAPEAMLQLTFLIKALQEETLIGKGPEYGITGFQPTESVPLSLVDHDWQGLWSATAPATQTALVQAYTQAWFTQISSYTPAEFHAGTDGNGRPWASTTENPALNDWTLFGGQVWASLPRLRYIGVSPALTYQISAWAATVWPAGNWTLNNTATCSSLSTCTSD
jgi:hypothetical protein